MTENTRIPVDDLINGVIMQLKEKNYMESTLSAYKRTYHRVREFMLLNEHQIYIPGSDPMKYLGKLRRCAAEYDVCNCRI